MRVASVIFFLICFSLKSFSQSSPVRWTIQCDQLDSNQYKISVAGIIDKGWHVYAVLDTAKGLTPPRLVFDSDNFSVSEAVSKSVPVIIADKLFSHEKMQVYLKDFLFSQIIVFRGAVPSSLKFKFEAFTSNDKEFLVLSEESEVKIVGGVQSSGASQIKLPTVHLDHPLSDCGDGQPSSEGKGFLAIFFLGIAGGLLALLTPCVFPMIPVTVSFFTGRARNRREGMRNGILYGVSIFCIYLLASVPFHLLGNINPEILNSISTNAWVNLAFFAIFIFFSLSFFGLFEISLPSSVVNKTDSKSGTGSMIGIFFMALTLATVSFSCTGPILGSLLVGSLTANGGAWQLTSGMAGFGLALALPFALFAMFPNWLKKLPRSGGWLDTVKKILAFLEMALAFKFLSNADLVQHWGILKRETFIGIWILISLGLTYYLLDKRKMILGTLALMFTVYLIPGLSHSESANLKLLSGFPPPLSYSIYRSQTDKKLKAHIVNDYAGALELSRKTGKPILIDFTGWACVNCRKMEEQVWTAPEIRDMIADKFILVSLYVDDRNKLPAAERTSYKSRDIITVGDKWATFQSENFAQVTQPLYAILSPGEELMNSPVGYTPDKKKYLAWLECGLEANKNGLQK